MGCAPSQPQPSQTQPTPKANTAPAPASPSKPKIEDATQLQRPVAPHQPTVVVKKDCAWDEDLGAVDRLLQATKSQIQARPLDLFADEASTISPKPPRSQQPSPMPQPMLVLSPPVEEASVEQPGTPPLPLQIASPTKPTAQPPISIPDDPWASLQATYAVQGSALDSPDALHKGTKRPDLRAGGNSWGNVNNIKGKGGGNASDIVVLDEDGDDTPLQGQPLYARQPMPAQVSAKPKQGGWGQGKMAQAGTLMVGDEELTHLAPPRPPHQKSRASTVDEDEEFEKIKSRIKANQAVADLGVEDIEDVDELIRQEEARDGLSAGLAAKLAAFEALGDD